MSFTSSPIIPGVLTDLDDLDLILAVLSLSRSIVFRMVQFSRLDPYNRVLVLIVRLEMSFLWIHYNLSVGMMLV